MNNYLKAIRYIVMLSGILLVLSAGCKKDEEETPDDQAITVTTSAVSNIITTSATCGGNVTSDGGSAITSRGVCWSTGADPTISNSHTSDGTGTGTFTSNLTNLTPNTLYHVRAYASNSTSTGYGSAVTFTTIAAGAAPTITFSPYPSGAIEIDFVGQSITSFNLLFTVTVTAAEGISTFTAKKKIGANTVNITPAPTGYVGQTNYTYNYNGTFLQTDFYPVYLTFTVTDNEDQSAEHVFQVTKKL